MRIANGVSYLLEGTARGKHCKGAAEGNLSGKGKPCSYVSHVAFRDTAVDMPVGESLLENACFGSGSKIRRQYYKILMILAQLYERVAVAGSGCYFLYF